MNRLNIRPVQRFIRTETFSGILLFGVTLLALLIANTPLRDEFANILDYRLGIETEDFELVKPLILWINDGLMAVFFFLIGLEIKREIALGELNSLKKASLPIFAAVGGMIVPVLFYLFINKNPDTRGAWGISMATDIAFTLAILRLLGNRVPLGLKIFLAAFAIIDDIGAVMVIAVFYSSKLSWSLLLIALGLLMGLYILSYLRLHSKFLFVVVGIIVWFLFLKAGIHPTLAGVLLAFAVPLRQRISEFEYAGKLKEITDRLTESTLTNPDPVLSHEQIEEIANLEDWTDKVQSPIQQLEHRLHGWVAYLIMPVFALANAGVSFSSNMEMDLPLVLTISISLFAGKALGVTLFSYLAIRTGLASLPQNIIFRQIIGVAILAGVGFTMSLFIAGLAFQGEAIYLDSAKVGIILGSVASGFTGYLMIHSCSKKCGPEVEI